MKKWLPTIAPLVLLLATALSSNVQHFVATQTAAHPWLAVLVACTGWIVNHWLTPPIAAAD